MNCHRTRRLLDEFADGELDPSARVRVQRHLDGCPACRESLRRLRMVMAEVGDLPALPLPDRFPNRLTARLSEDIPGWSRHQNVPTGWDVRETVSPIGRHMLPDALAA